uniref:Deoxynucleoside kinase domain-containing protein n=1 Tax=viral metagenome TaxID=1070528 RepID=A0A6C0I3G0_9ZZZZ
MSNTTIDTHVINVINFENPYIRYKKLERPLIVSLEGNIGAGKSTLLESLKGEFDPTILILQEPVDIWTSIRDPATDETVIQCFYRDPAKYAFSFQVLAYATRLSLLRKMIADHPECRMIICERSLDADKHIFAKMLHEDGMIDEVQYKIYETFFNEFSASFALDGIIYLDVDPTICHERVAIRNRDGEEGISLDYLYRCREFHEGWLAQNSLALKLQNMETAESKRLIKQYMIDLLKPYI